MLTLTAIQIEEIKRRLKPDIDANKRINRAVLYDVQERRCFWCGHLMYRQRPKYKGANPLAITIEHLDDRLDTDVIAALKGLRIVGAHAQCNHGRSRRQQQLSPNKGYYGEVV